MNPVYSPGSSGVPYANAKGVGYPAGFPMGYAAAAPAYSPSMYPGASPAFQTDVKKRGYGMKCVLVCHVMPQEGLAGLCFIRTRAVHFQCNFSLCSAFLLHTNGPRGSFPHLASVQACSEITRLLCFRLCPWHTLQSVLLPHQRGSAAVLLLSHPLPDCSVPRAERLPPAEPLRTAGRLLRPAPVRGAPTRHPPHHGGAARRPAGSRVPRAHPSSTRRRGRHGRGGRNHDGHVSRYPADGPLPNSCHPPPSHRAHVQGSGNANLQLRAPAVVITTNVQDGAGCRPSDALQPVLQASRLNQDPLLLLWTLSCRWLGQPHGPWPLVSN